MNFTFSIDHDPSSPRIESQDHRLTAGIRIRVTVEY